MRFVSRIVFSSALGFSASVLACGGGATPAPISITNNVSVVIVGAPSTDLPFNPREARLDAATQQLTAIAGHPITFELDVALLPSWRDGFEEALIETLENVARDLKELHKREPRAFAYGVPQLDRIVCRYSALADRNDDGYGRDEAKVAVFDEKAKVITLTSGLTSSLVPRASVAGAIDRRFEAYLTTRYGSAEPDAIAPAERADYFAYIQDGYHRQYDASESVYKKTPAGQGEPNRPSELIWIPRVAKLAALVGTSDPDLASRIRKWMFGKMDDFLRAYANDAPKVAAQPPGSRWRAAESAYVVWLDSVLPDLSDDESEIVARGGFVPATNGNATRFHHEAFPGFDAFAFGLREAYAWAAAGHPTESVQPQARANVFGEILCIENLGRHDRCAWLEFAAETDADQQRLADALIARKDAALTSAVVRGFPKATRMDFVHRLERDEPTLNAALRGMATMDLDPAIVSDLRRLWRAHPGDRGVLLYILTELDPYANPDDLRSPHVPWATFTQSFEGGATRSDIASFFTQGDNVVPDSRLVFFARATRASFVDLLIPELDAWFAGDTGRDPNLRHRFTDVVWQVCHDHDEAGMQELRDYFARRAASHPGDYLNSTMDSWPKGHCNK